MFACVFLCLFAHKFVYLYACAPDPDVIGARSSHVVRRPTTRDAPTAARTAGNITAWAGGDFDVRDVPSKCATVTFDVCTPHVSRGP